MKTINTNRKTNVKEYSRFSVPGFRSGSIIKKFIAIMYYCTVFVSMCSIVTTYLSGDFSGASDVALFVAVSLIILLIFLTPVIVIGFSDHFDWRGIKLVLLILTPWCVLFTLGNYLSTLFSESYIYSVNPSQQNIETTEDSSDGEMSDEEKAVEKIIESDGE
ncbi:MAG: hypothetical protein E7394_08605 [Ruminococcaceae bacterium]|nr:hypothetical protein [Oscillospiraceae bacterium]